MGIYINIEYWPKYSFKYFAIFTGKHLCWSLQVCNFITKRPEHRCFPVKIRKFLRTPILKSICKRLLL